MPFRDKEAMKQVLDAAGIRTPHHYRARTRRRDLERARAGRLSGDHQADRRGRFGGHLPGERARPGRGRSSRRWAISTRSASRSSSKARSSHSTRSARAARVLFYNICWYRPRPLIGKQNEWISQQTVVLRNPDVDHLASRQASWSAGARGHELPRRLHAYGVVSQSQTVRRCSARSGLVRRAVGPSMP